MRISNENNYVYWCPRCNVPLLQPQCCSCDQEGIRMVSDLRPVFHEEKQLLERFINEGLPEQTDLLWMNRRVLWYSGRHYLRFTGNEKPQINARYDYESTIHTNRDKNRIEMLAAANRLTLQKLERDAIDFINETTKQFNQCIPAVSFSGGKDSVVLSNLVSRAFRGEEVIHIFGDTTIELPDTYEFINSYKRNNPNTNLISASANRDWFEMCDVLQPPSRLTAWCCSVFKAA